jgi:hypothetical protein
MNEEPKSIWKKSWTGWSWLRAWLIIVAGTFFILLFTTFFIPGGPRTFSDWLMPSFFLLLVSTIISTIFVGLWFFMRCLCCWKNFRRLVFGLACFATLIALAYAEEDWRGWQAWNQFKHEWEAKGEKFDYASIVPPPVPDDQNFAMAPIWAESIKATLGPRSTRRWKYPDDGRTNFTDQMPTLWHNNDWSDSQTNGNWAKGTITDLKPWQTYYRTPTEIKLSSRKSVTTNDFQIAPQPQSPAQDVLLALSKYDPAIEELRHASQLPYSRFPLDYDSENPAVILLPHLSLLKRSALVLQLRSSAELQNAQSEKALADVKLSLSLANSIRAEPFLISQLVRIAILQITLQPIYEGLAQHQWSEDQLAALDAELAKLDFLADYRLSTSGEMGFQGGIIEYLRRHPEQFPNMSGNGDFINAPLPARIIWHSIPNGWFYQNRLNCARMMVEFYIPLADVNQRTISPSAVRHADEVVTTETKKITPYNVLERMVLPALGNAVKKFAYAQSSVDLARVAIALERYRLAHGEYPESLDALAPQFIEKVPHDIIGGQPSQGSGPASQPLHYRRTSDGQFVLYSVGWNERDDGGVVVLQKGSTPTVDINQGDWVWRYPTR